MTLATLGPVSSNFIVTGFALCAVFAFVIGAVVWAREGQLDDHDDELAEHGEQLATLAYQMPKLLQFLGIEIPAPDEDDSPEALEAEGAPQRATPTCICPDPRLTLGENADVRFPVEFDPDCQLHRPDYPTDEIPVCPPTVPDGMPLAVQSALIEQRPSPVPRTDSDEAKARKAAWVEAELAKIRERIDAGREAS